MNATLYTYHGIQYTYADLQTAYRRQQAETHKAIDCGNYAAACDINNKDVREYLPQMIDRKLSRPPASNQAAKPETKPNQTKPARKSLFGIICGLLK